jgi:hypothetical protein
MMIHHVQMEHCTFNMEAPDETWNQFGPFTTGFLVVIGGWAWQTSKSSS